jgi:hypothetical protein
MSLIVRADQELTISGYDQRRSNARAGNRYRSTTERDCWNNWEQPMSDKMDRNATVEIPILSLVATQGAEERPKNGEQPLYGLNSLSAPEREWLEWFYSLSENDQKIVEFCGEKDITATSASFAALKKVVLELESENPHLCR